MLSNLDTKCGTESILKEMSFFDASFTFLLTLLTVPMNSVILIAIFKYRPLLHRTFYLVIANIAAADLLAGVITCTLSISFHMKEGLGQHIPTTEVKALHYTFFVFNGISVMSMAVLSMDRLGVLLDPFVYYNKMTKRRMILLLSFTWLIAAALAILYFEVGYIRYLAIFALTTIILTMVIMITTMVLFKRRLAESEKAELGKDNPTGPSDLNSANKEKSQRKTLNNFTQMDKRITTTFLWMLVLFLINYLPVLIIVLYMNLCGTCSCQFIHITRDVVFLSILSSGLFRAINFTVRLTALHEAVKSILICGRKQDTMGYNFNCV